MNLNGMVIETIWKIKVMIIDDDIKEDRALPKSNPKTETNKEYTSFIYV